MVLDALNKKIKDSTLRYDLKQLKFLRKTLHMDSRRSIVIGLDTVKEISKDSLCL